MKLFAFVAVLLFSLNLFAYTWRIPDNPEPHPNDVVDIKPATIRGLVRRTEECIREHVTDRLIFDLIVDRRHTCRHCEYHSDGWKFDNEKKVMRRTITYRRDRFEDRGTRESLQLGGGKRRWWLDLVEWEVTYDFKTGAISIDYDSTFNWYNGHPREDEKYIITELPGFGFREIEDQSRYFKPDERFVDPYLFINSILEVSLIKRVHSIDPVFDSQRRPLMFDNREYARCLLGRDADELPEGLFKPIGTFDIDPESFRPKFERFLEY